MISKKNSFLSLIFVLFSGSLFVLISSCADTLNDKNTAKGLAKATGVTYPINEPKSETKEEKSYNADSTTKTILYGNGYYIFNFSAEANTRYTISWSCETGKYLTVSAGRTESDVSSYFISDISPTLTTQIINLSVARVVYIKVTPYTGSDFNAGSFTLTVSNTNDKSVSLRQYAYYEGTKTEDTDVPDDTDDKYSDSKSGSFSINDWSNNFSFYAYADIPYLFSLEASDTDVYVLYFESENSSFIELKNGQTIKRNTDGTVYLSVRNLQTPADYTFTVSNSNEKNISLKPCNDYAVLNGEIIGSQQYYIYSFYAYENINYGIRWNDEKGKLSYSVGDNPSMPTSLVNSGDYTLKFFTPSSSGILYIKIQKNSFYSTAACAFTLGIFSSRYKPITISELGTK